MRYLTSLYLIFSSMLVAGAGGFFIWSYLSSQSEEATFYPTQYVGEAGVCDPALVDVEDADLRQDEPVFGVFVEGEARAYQKRAFEIRSDRERPGRHVVNDLVGEQPVTIVHCDRNDCTRVFLGEPADSSLDVGVAGWERDKGLILKFGGTVYPLESASIPLDQLEFLETTWGEWLQLYPDTKVYINPTSQAATIN